MIHDLDWNQEVVIVNLLDILPRHNDRLLLRRFLHCSIPLAGPHMEAPSHALPSDCVSNVDRVIALPTTCCSVKLTCCCSSGCPGSNAGKGTLEIVRLALWGKRPLDDVLQADGLPKSSSGFARTGPVAQCQVCLCQSSYLTVSPVSRSANTLPRQGGKLHKLLVFLVDILHPNLSPEHPQIGIASSRNMSCPNAAFPKSHCAVADSTRH